MGPSAHGDTIVLGLGLDVADIERFERERARHGPAFGEEFLAEPERARCERDRRPARAQALHFAAKEAFLKAVGTGLAGGVRWRDVELGGSAGASRIVARGAAAEVLDRIGVDEVRVSLGATARHAAAAVVLVGRRIG